MFCFSYRCTPTFECDYEKKKNHGINMCMNIEQVIPQTISTDSLNTEVNFLIKIVSYFIFDWF
jgi:hypothetical protein